MNTILDYLLTLADGTTEQVSTIKFTEWVRAQGEHVGASFQTRLEQFRRYTGKKVKDWEMIDL